MKPVILLCAIIGAIEALPPRQYVVLQPFRPVRQSPQTFQPQRQSQQVQRFQDPGQAYILRYDSNVGGYGGYHFNVETSDGFYHRQIGNVQKEGTPQEALAVEGEYSYVGPDSKEYKVHYTADENGFQPTGEHLPKAASTKKKLGIPSAALASLAGGGLG